MKTLLFILSILPIMASPVRITWDQQENATFEVWRGIDKLATVITNEATIDLPVDQMSTIRVITISEETLLSSELIIRPIVIPFSKDLETWNSFVGFVEDSSSMFFRLKTPGIPELILK